MSKDGCEQQLITDLSVNKLLSNGVRFRCIKKENTELSKYEKGCTNKFAT